MEKKIPIYFLIGYPRSGTTILTRILGAHPNIYAHQKETNYFTMLMNRRMLNWNLKNKKLFNKFLKRLKKYFLLVQAIFIPWEDIEKIILNSPKNYQDILINILLAHSKSLGKNNPKIIIERSPTHTFIPEIILKFYPDTKFIFIVRDPRAVINSLLKKEFFCTTDNFFEGLSFWKDINYLTHKKLKKIPCHKILVVKYENLVKDPQKEIRKVTDFLNIEFDKSMLNPENFSQTLPFYHKLPPIFNKTFHKISTEYINEWENILSSKEVSLIEYFASDFMRKYGYTKTQEALSLWEVIKFNLTNLHKLLIMKFIQMLAFLIIREFPYPIMDKRRYFSLLWIRAFFKTRA